MSETSRFWDGLVTGDSTAAPYDAATEFAKVMMSITGAGRLANLGGVFHDELNALAVSGTASPISVASGRAQVWGTWYETDAATAVTIPTPSASTRIDRIVLRKDWSGHTVRIVRKAGTEGGAEPALTQVAGTTWEVPLAKVSITTGGVITLTDEREYISPYAGSASGLVLIQELSGTGASATLSFTSIPATYKNLVIKLVGASTVAATDAATRMRFNGDSGSNYVNEAVYIAGTGSTRYPTEVEETSSTSLLVGSVTAASGPANGAGQIDIDIDNYIGSFHKTHNSRFGFRAANTTTNINTGMASGHWLNTAVISQIDLIVSSGSWGTGTRAQLYGMS